MKNLLFICSMVLLSIPSFSQKRFQPGYIINLDGDTLKGIIEYGNWDKNPKAVSFKDALSSNPNIYGPEQIQGFLVNNEFYQSAIVDVDTSAHKMTELDDSPVPKYRRDTVFLFSLVRGNRSLYFLKDGNSKNHFYIDDDGFKPLVFKEYIKYVSNNLRYVDKKTIFNNSEYQSQLAVYLNDCTSIQHNLTKLHYTVPSLLELFSQYYSCTGKAASYVNKRKDTEHQAGILAGASISDLTFADRDIPSGNAERATNVSVGFFVDWRLLRTRGLDIAQDLFLTTNKTEVIAYRVRAASYDTITSVLTLVHLKTSHQLRFNLFQNRGLYISSGISLGMMMEKRSSTTKNSFVASTIDTRSSKVEFGQLISLGYRVGRLSAEARLERSTLSGGSLIAWKHVFLRYRIL